MQEPEIILGPPGTGKTTRLIRMVEEELAAGTEPDRIGYVSFTRKAADEARNRAVEKFKLPAKKFPWFRTIHSLCFHALGLTSAEVLEGSKLKEFGDWIGIEMSGFASMDEGGSFGYKTGDRCLFMENLARVRGIPLRQQYEQDSDNLPWNLVDRVSRGLAEYKKAKGLHDFTDMLTEFVRTEWTARLEVLFVDERQDLSKLQVDVVQKLAKGTRRYVVAGDDDQAIYRWAGADVRGFVDLPGRTSTLEQSWRVPKQVQGVALEVLQRVRDRRPKSWTPRKGDAGRVDRIGVLDEVDFAAGENILVLSRNTQALRDDAMPLLRSEGVIYEFRGGGSVKQSVVDAILDWERLRKGEEISVQAALRVYDQMEVGPGTIVRGHKKLPYFGENKDAMVDMRALREHGGLVAEGIWHDALNRIVPEDRAYMLKALRRGEKLTRRPTVKLSTIHGAKGGEADHVVLLRDVAYRTARESDDQQWEDEARVFYVAVTRALKRLTIVAPQTRHSYDV
jgi:superfamily I DNA/RNA helicase